MLKLRSLPFKWQDFNLFVTKIIAHLLHPFSRILLSQELTIFSHDPGGHEVKQGCRAEAVNRPQSLSENII